MRWERFFEDLEAQLDSEWEAERAALDTEAERLRVSKLTLRERLVGAIGAAAGVEVSGGATVTGTITAVGADWCALSHSQAHADVVLIPLHAVAGLTLTHETMLRAARSGSAGSEISQRMTFGFVVRDLVRRRISVTIELASRRVLTGTIDRAGADHLDIALHDAGAPRRAAAVTGYRLVPFGAIAAVRADSALPL